MLNLEQAHYKSRDADDDDDDDFITSVSMTMFLKV